MTAAFNLAQLANNLNTSGQLDATDGLVGLVTNANLASSGSASSSTYLRGDRTWASLPALGKVLQVVQTSKTDTYGTSAGTWQDITGLSVTITPSSSSSRILFLAQIVSGQDTGNLWSMRLLRNGTPINIGDASGSKAQGLQNANYRDLNAENMTSPVFVDSPATTSACTYKIQVITEAGYAFYLNRTANDINDTRQARTASNLIAIEIGA